MCLPSTFWRTERRTVVIPMTSQFCCLELLITRTVLLGPVKFEITRATVAHFFYPTFTADLSGQVEIFFFFFFFTQLSQLICLVKQNSLLALTADFSGKVKFFIA